MASCLMAMASSSHSSSHSSSPSPPPSSSSSSFSPSFSSSYCDPARGVPLCPRTVRCVPKLYRGLGISFCTPQPHIPEGTPLHPINPNPSPNTNTNPNNNNNSKKKNGKIHWSMVFLGFSKGEKPWAVPWSWSTIVQVMFLWFCTFWLVGSWVIPVLAHYSGFSKESLTYRGQAVYSLVTDIAEGIVGLGILHRCLLPFYPLPRNWFQIRWRGQWYADVLLGCFMFPLVNMLSQLNLDLLPLPSPIVSYEQSIMSRDPIASLLYAVVVSVCCPIWEEVIFRGFLLPSLTRYLPIWASVFVSAVVFGLAHFNMQRILPLTFLGLVMGILFVRSRNLLSSMFLHSLWNGFVFVGLLK